MVKLTVDIPEDLAQWLAANAATRGCSRQDQVVEMLRNQFEPSARFDALLDKGIEEEQDLLQRLAEWQLPGIPPRLVETGHKRGAVPVLPPGYPQARNWSFATVDPRVIVDSKNSYSPVVEVSEWLAGQ